VAVDEASWITTNAAALFGLAAIENLALIGEPGKMTAMNGTNGDYTRLVRIDNAFAELDRFLFYYTQQAGNKIPLPRHQYSQQQTNQIQSDSHLIPLK
jgi:hypothetical protein